MNIVLTKNEVYDILTAYIKQNFGREVVGAEFNIQDTNNGTIIADRFDLKNVTCEISDVVQTKLGPIKREVLFGNDRPSYETGPYDRPA